MLTDRASGILLHPTSLPGPYGAGDFGPDAYKFVDWLVGAGQTYWQVLPLGDIGPGNSPYMSSSAFAGNILLIDLNDLKEKGWLEAEDIVPSSDFRADRIDFQAVQKFRRARLRRAAQAFLSNPRSSIYGEYLEFCDAEKEWLDDYALFMTINGIQNGLVWNHWPEELAKRTSKALGRVVESATDEINFWKFCQWSFSRQWAKLKAYANERGVRIIGDVPIFVAYHSADVWAHQDLFELDAKGNPLVVAGVPPDYFSETGQLWGNPLYRWRVHEASHFSWWIARLRHALRLADLVRIDHFRGFAAYWEVPATEKTAIGGSWKPGPGARLFEAFREALGSLPIIAEDLGVITPDVVELREKFALPGMRILQFAFGEDESHYFLPHNYIPNCIAYTGTHDNDTSLGWWNAASANERLFAQRYLNSDGHDIHWNMIDALSSSKSNTVIFPMQDVLGLAGEHRMNYPGHQNGNWEWRFTWDMVRPDSRAALLKITVDHNRILGGTRSK
jgi:4-alpha-glucanotransferase